MTATVGANFGMNYAWASGEDGWNVGMDANLLKIDTLAKLKVINYTTTTPPVSPSEGDVYIVGVGATGAWSGLDKNVVVRTGTSWTSYTPVKGWLAYDENTSSYIGYNGTSWIVDPVGVRSYAEDGVGSQVYRWFEDFITTGSSTSNVFIAIGCNNQGMSTVSPLEAFTNASISGASLAMGWVCLFNTGGMSAGSVSAIQGYDGYSKVPLTASKEIIFAGALDTLPEATSTRDCVHRIGMCGYGVATTTNPVAQSAASVYFQADKDGFWKCFSGKTGSSQSTTTSVATSAMTYISLQIVIAPTTGVVSFYINGTLVATHSAAGAVPYEQPWYRFISLYNQGVGTFPATSGLGGRGNLFIDAWGQKVKAISDRTNLRFIS